MLSRFNFTAKRSLQKTLAPNPATSLLISREMPGVEMIGLHTAYGNPWLSFVELKTYYLLLWQRTVVSHFTLFGSTWKKCSLHFVLLDWPTALRAFRDGMLTGKSI